MNIIRCWKFPYFIISIFRFDIYIKLRELGQNIEVGNLGENITINRFSRFKIGE